MKPLTTVLTAAQVIILVCLLAATGLPQANAVASAAMPVVPAAIDVPQQQENACDLSRTVQVSGTAVVNVTPDRALIQLGIQSNGTTPQRVEAINSNTIQQIVKALRKLGVEEKDIVTDRYTIWPVYDSYNSLMIKGYRIDNMVAVTLRDIGKANQVIVAALEAGANQLINVEFYLSDLRTYRDRARQLAVQAAREKAAELASAAGVAVGCVISINENTWSNYYGGWFGQSRDLWTQNAVQNIAPTGGQTSALADEGPFNLGQISVRAEVSASFSLR